MVDSEGSPKTSVRSIVGFSAGLPSRKGHILHEKSTAHSWQYVQLHRGHGDASPGHPAVSQSKKKLSDMLWCCLVIFGGVIIGL